MKINSNTLAQRLRFKVIEMSYRAKAPHLASALSCIDIITVLYNDIMKYSVKKELKNKDYFILSKRACCNSSLFKFKLFWIYIRKRNVKLCKKKNSIIEEHPL